MFIYGETAVLNATNNGFSIKELYRGLSPRQGFEKRDMGTWEIHITVFCIKEGGRQRHDSTGVFSNKLRRQEREEMRGMEV